MVKNTVVSYPTPPYSNPPIEPQFYQPSQFFISAIATGVTTTITTSVNHNYVIGQEVRFVIPFIFGTRGLNGLSGIVLSIPSPNQVIVNINSNGFDPFIPSPALAYTKAQIMAIGDFNSGAINANGRIQNITSIPGSFINISPL